MDADSYWFHRIPSVRSLSDLLGSKAGFYNFFVSKFPRKQYRSIGSRWVGIYSGTSNESINHELRIQICRRFFARCLLGLSVPLPRDRRKIQQTSATMATTAHVLGKPSAAWRLFYESANGDGRRTPHQTHNRCIMRAASRRRHKMLIIFKLNSFPKWNLFAFVRQSVGPTQSGRFAVFVVWTVILFIVFRSCSFRVFYLHKFFRCAYYSPHMNDGVSKWEKAQIFADTQQQWQPAGSAASSIFEFEILSIFHLVASSHKVKLLTRAYLGQVSSNTKNLYIHLMHTFETPHCRTHIHKKHTQWQPTRCFKVFGERACRMHNS